MLKKQIKRGSFYKDNLKGSTYASLLSVKSEDLNLYKLMMLLAETYKLDTSGGNSVFSSRYLEMLLLRMTGSNTEVVVNNYIVIYPIPLTEIYSHSHSVISDEEFIWILCFEKDRWKLFKGRDSKDILVFSHKNLTSFYEVITLIMSSYA